jgi:hypothetical protein
MLSSRCQFPPRKVAAASRDVTRRGTAACVAPHDLLLYLSPDVLRTCVADPVEPLPRWPVAGRRCSM